MLYTSGAYPCLRQAFNKLLITVIVSTHLMMVIFISFIITPRSSYHSMTVSFVCSCSALVVPTSFIWIKIEIVNVSVLGIWL